MTESRLYIPPHATTTGDDPMPQHVPEVVYEAASRTLQGGPMGHVISAGMHLDESQIREKGEQLVRQWMKVRRACDNDDQFELIAATAYRSGDMEGALRNYLQRVEDGTFIKPNASDWSHRKEALTKGTLSTQPSRAERRRWAALQRKRAKREKSIEARLKRHS